MLLVAKRLGLFVAVVAVMAAIGVGVYWGWRRTELRQPTGATMVLATVPTHAPMRTDAH